MGCASSKQHRVCRNCKAPITRSYSMHAHYPPQPDHENENHHVVALKSSTLGYLKLDPSNSIDAVHIHPEQVHQSTPTKDVNELTLGLIDAKEWSKMIDEKIPKFIPKTPIATPPGEPETINAWELMEGLDDTSPLRPKLASNHIRSFSFHVNPNSFPSCIDAPEPVNDSSKNDQQNDQKNDQKTEMTERRLNNSDSNTDSSSNDSSIAPEFDSEVISEFRKSLELLQPENPFYLKPAPAGEDGEGEDSLEVTDTKKMSQNGFINNGKSNNNSPPRVKERLVLYFTSLRGVRKTYEDCCHVRHVLKATGVRVDERDVSMHSGFKDELKELLGGYIGGLPKVFIGKRCVGGAVEIRRLHEDGQLEKALEGCEMAGGDVGCEACGDMRFVPCETCSGSCKIYYEDGYDESDDEEKDGSDCGFQRCPDCNENGLIRCPICCD